LDPPQKRAPLPFPLVALLVQTMLDNHKVLEAVSIMLMFVAYLRPWELQGISKHDLVLPNRSCRHFSINLHPSSREEVSKMGMTDESIMLDSKVMPFLGMCLQKVKSQYPGPLLLPVDAQTLRLTWESTLVQIGLKKSHAVLHQLRHSGPSFDMLTKARTLLEIKLRGRWASDSSVRRYESHAWLGQEFQNLPKKVQKLALKAEQNLPATVQKFFKLRLFKFSVDAQGCHRHVQERVSM
jgi:integrase